MKFLRDTNWEEVFGIWRDHEANDPGWVETAVKIKGWPDWESWRRHSAGQIGAEKLDWKLYQFENPQKEISEMLIGPYTGWQSRVQKKNQTTFSELFDIPEQYEYFSGHGKVTSIRNAMPYPTTMIGLIRDDIGRVVCMEGHHRAAAIALAKKRGEIIDFSRVEMTVALAHLPKEECSLLDEVLKRGSSRSK
jgi:hypothetical protein